MTNEVFRLQYQVLIVHHDKEIRNRICRAIRADSELAVWGEADSIRKAYTLLGYGLPALALIDPGLADGSGEKVISWLHKHAPYVTTLALSRHGDEHRENTATNISASGYLHNYHEAENITSEIKLVLKARSPVFPHATRCTDANTGKVSLFDPATDCVPGNICIDKPKLTAAETDILNYIAKGFTGPEIADITGRSVNTVPVHIKSIYRKLSVSGRGEAVFRALQLGLIGND